jgi:hypothetical protein
MLGFGGTRQFEEREGVAAGNLQKALAAFRHQSWSMGIEKVGRVRRLEAFEPKLGETRIVQAAAVPVADREQHGDRLHVDASSNEGQHLAGVRIEPMRVLDDEQQRRVRCCIRKEVQRGQRDQEEVRRRPVAVPAGQSKRGGERCSLRTGKLRDPLHARPQ